MAIAIFPQTGTISKSKIEPQFKNVKESDTTKAYNYDVIITSHYNNVIYVM